MSNHAHRRRRHSPLMRIKIAPRLLDGAGNLDIEAAAAAFQKHDMSIDDLAVLVKLAGLAAPGGTVITDLDELTGEANR
jgi:hypothetical protein